MPDQIAPQLTDSHKLRIVLIQRAFLDAGVIITNQQQAQTKLQGDLNVALNEIAQELKIDSEKWAFALDTLAVIPKQ